MINIVYLYAAVKHTLEDKHNRAVQVSILPGSWNSHWLIPEVSEKHGGLISRIKIYNEETGIFTVKNGIPRLFRNVGH
jgi:hypothetical protein